MRTARRLHKTAMTFRGFDKDGLPTKKIYIDGMYVPFRPWIREQKRQNKIVNLVGENKSKLNGILNILKVKP